MVDVDAAVEEYKSVLSELTGNDRFTINLLTLLAEDYFAHSDAIIDATEDYLVEVGEWQP